MSESTAFFYIALPEKSLTPNEESSLSILLKDSNNKQSLRLFLSDI